MVSTKLTITSLHRSNLRSNNMKVKGGFIQVLNSSTKFHNCSICGKIYRNFKSLIRHKKYECQKPPNFMCSQCSYRAKYRSSVKTHLVLRHARRRYQCHQCQKSYTMPRNLRRHLTVECGKERSFKCTNCSNTFYYKRDMMIHLFRKHIDTTHLWD
nr:unnamed protein product [Callosobruchus analis]